MSASAMHGGHNNCSFNNNNICPVTFTWCRHSQTMLLSSGDTALDHVHVIDASATTIWSRSQSVSDTVAGTFCWKHLLVLYSYILELCSSLRLTPRCSQPVPVANCHISGQCILTLAAVKPACSLACLALKYASLL